MNSKKKWPVKKFVNIENDGMFYDSYGNRVKHGMNIIIESNYNYQHWNNRPAIAEWDSKKGLYTFRFIDGDCMGLVEGFHGIHKFKVKN